MTDRRSSVSRDFSAPFKTIPAALDVASPSAQTRAASSKTHKVYHGLPVLYAGLCSDPPPLSPHISLAALPSGHCARTSMRVHGLHMAFLTADAFSRLGTTDAIFHHQMLLMNVSGRHTLKKGGDLSSLGLRKAQSAPTRCASRDRGKHPVRDQNRTRGSHEPHR